MSAQQDEPIKGYAGQFALTRYWGLTPRSRLGGNIIQTVKLSGFARNFNTQQVEQLPTFDYDELWQVFPNSGTISARATVPHPDEGIDQGFDRFFFSGASRCTEGYVMFKATAGFYQGRDETGFTRGNVPAAGSRPSRQPSQPFNGILRSNLWSETVIAYWECSDKRTKVYIGSQIPGFSSVPGSDPYPTNLIQGFGGN